MPLFETIPVERTVVEGVLQKHWNVSLDKLVKESQNHTFTAKRQDGTQLSVRVTPDPRGIHIGRIKLELSFIEYLKKEGLDVCGPIPSSDGKVLVCAGDLCIVVFEFAKGSPVDYFALEWLRNKDFVHSWGEWLGKFHIISKKFATEFPEKAKEFRKWDELHDAVLKDASIAPQDRETADDPNKFGILHGDLNISNFFYNPESFALCVFDWDQAMRGWYMYDLAQIIFSAYSLKRGGLATKNEGPRDDVDEDEFTNAVVEGYERATGPGTVDRGELHRMLMLRREFYETFCRKAVLELDPEGFMGKFCASTLVWIDRCKSEGSRS